VDNAAVSDAGCGSDYTVFDVTGGAGQGRTRRRGGFEIAARLRYAASCQRCSVSGDLPARSVPPLRLRV